MDIRVLFCVCVLPNINGSPLNRRFLGLFGLSISNPADQSGLYNIKVPGDATGYLDITHQHYSASATGTGYVQHQGQNGPGSFSLQTSGSGPNSLPGKCNTVITSKCPIDCREIDSVTGCIGCKAGCASPMCPAFPSNCPRGNVALVNGCPICIAYLTSTQQTTTAQAQSSTCGPVRCLSPCNKGIMIAADGCPKCVC
ncbi:uncharacterized protein LOC125661535 [Ostrea edulis]|uniref:uncharacterized protein LOC125661535 n=1 Tax=Ostrea edulis TaxID=37623 RepID=UPI0024AFF652|nr:uncharacterized protein LOC125661535 [Ostrea edulis]